MYACSLVSPEGVCLSWEPLQQGFLSLSAAEGAEVGLMAIGVMALAWGVRQIFELVMTTHKA